MGGRVLVYADYWYATVVDSQGLAAEVFCCFYDHVWRTAKKSQGTACF